MLVGVLGGGQLGRMLAIAGLPLGLRFRFLDPSPDAVAGHAGELIVGDYADPAALERFTRGLDAATFEFENVPAPAAEFVAARVPLSPGVLALRTGQDRLLEKELFARVGLATPDYAAVDDEAQLADAAQRLGYPLVVKSRRLGYDGKGQRMLRTPADLAGAWSAVGGVPAIVERLVPFERELSIILARGRDGACAVYPLTHNVHAGGILRVSRAPARASDVLARDAERAAREVARHLDYVGVLALELFEVGGRLLGNELAPRVHNSGHWTIDAARCSQFENHCRAIAGLPLGDPTPIGPAAMVNFIGAMPPPASVLALPATRLHDYAKQPRPGRKVGHTNVWGPDAGIVESSTRRLLELARDAEADVSANAC